MKFPKRNVSALAVALVGALAISPATASDTSTTRCPGTDLLAANASGVAVDADALLRKGRALDNNGGALWRIEQEEESRKPASYLYGMLNVADTRVSRITPQIEAVLARTRRIGLAHEVVTARRMAEAVGSMHEATLLKPGKKLDGIVGAQDLQRISLAGRRAGLGPDAASCMQPWLAGMLLNKSECQLRLTGPSSNLTFEHELMRASERRGVGSFAVESIEMMIAGLTQLSEKAQNAFLKAQLERQAKLDDIVESKIRLYLANETGALGAFDWVWMEANGVDPEIVTELRQALLIDRNARVRDRSLMHVNYGGVFIVADIRHLPGKHGLIELYREAGYKVTRVDQETTQ